jgi:hypothetical protein
MEQQIAGAIPVAPAGDIMILSLGEVLVFRLPLKTSRGGDLHAGPP